MEEKNKYNGTHHFQFAVLPSVHSGHSAGEHSHHFWTSVHSADLPEFCTFSLDFPEKIGGNRHICIYIYINMYINIYTYMYIQKVIYVVIYKYRVIRNTVNVHLKMKP